MKKYLVLSFLLLGCFSSQVSIPERVQPSQTCLELPTIGMCYKLESSKNTFKTTYYKLNGILFVEKNPNGYALLTTDDYKYYGPDLKLFQLVYKQTTCTEFDKLIEIAKKKLKSKKNNK